MSPQSDSRIGVPGEYFPVSLKQLLLFFDKLAIFDLEGKIEILRSWKQDQGTALANDLEFLKSKQIVFQPGPFYQTGKDLLLSFAPDIDDFMNVAAFLIRELELESEAKKKEKDRDFAKFFVTLNSQSQFHARLYAKHLQRSEAASASVILSTPLIFPEGVKSSSDRSGPTSTNVIDVILKRLPMPSKQTPLEAILDFRMDPEAAGYLNGLRLWINDAVQKKLTTLEAKEKLEWLLFQHQQHLRIHKLAAGWGTFGATFVAIAEIVEDLAKLKLGKAAAAIVSIGDRKLDLLKAEASSPFKEVNYIVKAQEEFGK